MNTMFPSKNFICLSSLAALAVASSSLPATAQTTPSAETPTINGVVTPIPGTTATSSAMLNSELPSATAQPSSNQIAQSDIEVGGATRGGSSYLGVGGNIGITGESSALSDGNFTVISKIGFTRNFSVRPSAILGDDTVFLVPVTYDFSFQSLGDPFSEPLPIAPYVGVGAAIKTGDNSETAVLVTGGIDVPLNNRFTATAAVNAGFFDKTDVGVLFGVGYNFSGF